MSATFDSLTASSDFWATHDPFFLQNVVPLDLWAIHDLLIVGKKGPLLRPTAGNSHKMEEEAAQHLGDLMCDLHPIAACREAVCKATSVEDKAAASWSCLGLTAADFTEAYTPEEANSKAMQEVDRTTPKFVDKLGVCKDSQWQRACSYWTSMHVLGLRADLLKKGQDFFNTMVQIISGGVLYCTGCTWHFRFLNQNMLSKEVIAEDIMDY